MLIPIVPSVPKGRRGHASCSVRVAGVDLMDLSGILGVARGRVGGDGRVVYLGLGVVVGDDGEGWIWSRGGSVDKVGGEVECLTGVCATGVDDEVGAVTGRGVSERNDEFGEVRASGGKGSKGPGAARCPLGCRGRACGARRANGEKKNEGRQRALQGPRAIGMWSSWKNRE